MTLNEFISDLRKIAERIKASETDVKKYASRIAVKIHAIDDSSNFAHKLYNIGGFKYSPSDKKFIIIPSSEPNSRFKNLFVFASELIQYINNLRIDCSADVFIGTIPLEIPVSFNSISNELLIEYLNPTETISESVLDSPKAGLDPNVWVKNESGEIVFTEEAKAKTAKILKWLRDKHHISDMKVYIIGSITSNSYAVNSDIDLNICSPVIGNEQEAADLCRKIKKDYVENFVPNNEKDAYIGTHPFEIYMQHNPYRCFSSVGCYDFFQEKWLIGPEFKNMDFDPASEYYGKGQRGLKTEMKDIRNTILDIYELALVISKSRNKEFKQKKFENILTKLSHAQKLFTKIHDARAKYDDTNVDSTEDALKIRQNQQRTKADANYKFLDKFGYVQILRDYAQLSKDIEEKEPIMEEYLSKIISSVHDNLDPERMLADEMVVESLALQQFKIISLPKSEKNEIWQTYTGRDIDKYHLGDIVKTRDNRFYRVNIVQKIHDVIDHPKYDELLKTDIDELLTSDGFEYIVFHRIDDTDESLKTYALAGLMAVSGLFTQSALSKELNKVPASQLRFNSPAVAAAMERAAIEKQSWNGLSFVNMTNLLASVSYNEGMLDYIKTGDENCLIAVLNSIDNRAGGDPKYYAIEIMTPSQYFSVRHLNTRKLANCVDKKYIKWDPRQAATATGHQISPRQAECWRLCNEFAVQLLKKQLPAVIGDRNMLANAKIDDKDAWNAWGSKCDLRVGNQMYGYEKEHDGYLKYNTKKPAGLNHIKPKGKIYIVQSGDTLGKIAEKHNTTVAQILIKNQIKDPNKIRVGQKLRIS